MRRIPYFLGLDVGGTNLKALAVSEAGDDLVTYQFPTGDDGVSASWLENVKQLMGTIISEQGNALLGVGIAAPGLPALGKPVITAMPGRLLGIEGLDWREFFSFPEETVVTVLNDARAALWGEVWRGAAKGESNVVLLTLGTGVGGAVMVDGRVLQGASNRAGHLGHISLNPWGLPDCVLTPGSLEDAVGDMSLQSRSGGRYTAAEQLLEPLRAGDAAAWAIWLRAVDSLAAGVVSMINLYDPAVVVLGGGIAKAGPLLFAPLEKAVRRMEWVLAGNRIPLVPTQLGSHSGAVGAARAAMEAFNSKP